VHEPVVTDASVTMPLHPDAPDEDPGTVPMGTVAMGTVSP